tara:strand:+ start:2640 stop:3104 length:465 start_codon:yes stop_codon:yes gene_type:complete
MYIYNIVCGNELYIGSTKDIEARKKQHKLRFDKLKFSHLPLYTAMKNGYEINILEEIDCSKKELLELEHSYIIKFKPTLNSRRAIVSIEEKREDNRLRQQRYNMEGRYTERLKNYIRPIIPAYTCECGSIIAKHVKRHLNSIKHKNYISVNNIV